MAEYRGDGWRLVHDGKKVLSFFYEEKGITETINTLFIGTKEKCEVEIRRLGLDASEIEPEGVE